MPKKAGGFTLLEMIVVLMVMSILIGLSFPSLAAYRRNAAASEAEKLEGVVARGIVQYYALEGRYPTTLTDGTDYVSVSVDGVNANQLTPAGLAAFSDELARVTGVTLTAGLQNYDHVYYYTPPAANGLPPSIRIDRP